MSRRHQANDLAHTGLLSLCPQPLSSPRIFFLFIRSPFILSFLPFLRHATRPSTASLQLEYEGRSQPRGPGTRPALIAVEALGLDRLSDTILSFSHGSRFPGRGDAFILLVTLTVVVADGNTGKLSACVLYPH